MRPSSYVQEQLIGEIFDVFENGLTSVRVDFPFQLIVDRGIDLEGARSSLPVNHLFTSSKISDDRKGGPRSSINL